MLKKEKRQKRIRKEKRTSEHWKETPDADLMQFTHGNIYMHKATKNRLRAEFTYFWNTLQEGYALHIICV